LHFLNLFLSVCVSDEIFADLTASGDKRSESESQNAIAFTPPSRECFLARFLRSLLAAQR
jgi:hypothetical protein